MSIDLDFNKFIIGIMDVNSDINNIELELLKVGQALADYEAFSLDFTIKNEQLVMLFKSNQVNISSYVERALKHTILSHKRFSNIDLSCGLSLVFSNHNFRKSYDQAVRGRWV